jgi:hypothetical protein
VLDGFVDREVRHQHFIERGARLVDRDSESAGGVALRIDVDEEDSLAFFGKRKRSG